MDSAAIRPDGPHIIGIMLNRDRLLLAIQIQAQSYQLLQWIGTAIEKGQIPLARAEQHSDSPDAAMEWIARTRWLLPHHLQPDETHLREFACFFWTYVTSSFDVIPNPGTRQEPGNCGCSCPMCARITNAPHLQPKKLSKSDKRRAGELIVERVAALATEEGLFASPEQCHGIANDSSTRRFAAYSTYGQWLINRLSGFTDGPAILALWREIAWTRMGSPIQGFSLRYEDFEFAEKELVRVLQNNPELKQTPGTTP